MDEEKIVIPAQGDFQKHQEKTILANSIYISTPPVIPAHAGIQKFPQLVLS